jgi:hypothetical protein
MTAETFTGKLSESARQILERYLWELRLSLQGCRSVNAAEVEADVKQHIDHELTGTPEPVSPEQLDAVLKKLGSPRQWVPDEELSWWRRAMLKLRTGPHDVRLASATLVLLVLGLIFVPLTWPFLLASFLLARAMLSMVAEQEQRELGWQRWLIYPSLLIVYLPLAAILLAWPALLGALAEEMTHDRSINPWNGQPWNYLPDVPFAFASGAAGLSAWWAILSVVVLIWPQLPRHLFRPFAGRVNRLLALALLLVSLLIFSVSAVAVTNIVNSTYAAPVERIHSNPWDSAPRTRQF